MKTKKQKFVETFVKKPMKKPEPVKVEEKKPVEAKPKLFFVEPIVAPLCDCGKPVFETTAQCWGCAHRV